MGPQRLRARSGCRHTVAGFLADRFGIKRVHGIGQGSSALGSLLSGSNGLWTLVAARAIQGFGGGIAQPLSVAMLFMAFLPREQGHAFGIFGIVMVGAPALRPLRGWLVDRDLWRWIFFINIPIGILDHARSSVAASTAARAPRKAQSSSVIQQSRGLAASSTEPRLPRGVVLCAVLGTLGFGVVALAAFTIIQLRGSHRNRSWTFGCSGTERF